MTMDYRTCRVNFCCLFGNEALFIKAMMSRKMTQLIAYILDFFIPLCIRDARWFMRPLFQVAFKKWNVRHIMDFKTRAFDLSNEEFSAMYRQNPSIFDSRPTDLTPQAKAVILENTLNSKGQILDVGSGRGLLCRALKDQNPQVRVVGLDMAKQFEDSNIEFFQGFAEALPFQNESFDTVVCVHTLEHTRNLAQAISELKRVAKFKLIVIVPRQRYFKFTLDFHLHFFYSYHSLGCLFNLPYTGQDLDGEIILIFDAQRVSND